MKRMIAILLCAVLLPFCLAGCNEKADGNEGDTSSLFPENYQSEGWVGFRQNDSGAEEGYDPSVILTAEGKFIFTFFTPEKGTDQLRGTYREEGDGYVLTAAEGSNQEFYNENSEEIRLKKKDGTLIYSGKQIGVTAEGDVFTEDFDLRFP